MPREISLTSTRPMQLTDLVRAGSAVNPSLVPRSLLGGWAIQLVDAGAELEGRSGPETSEPVAVLTVELSRRIDDRYDLERLTGATGLPADAEVWFTEATAPWGPHGEPGVRIVQELARLLEARLIVEDGR